MNVAPPQQCRLCESSRTPKPAGFRQQYRQADSPSLPVAWWECPNCRGWYAYPVPSVEAIGKNWSMAPYADPAAERVFAEEKQRLTQRTLAGLAKHGVMGELLDVGCNTGMFMLAAKEAGWSVAGFDPNKSVVEAGQSRGLDVRHGWTPEECGFASGRFQAVTAIDVFYYSWHPLEDLRSYSRLLGPGGVLAMRISNKRLILGLARRLTPPGPARDARLSRMLQGQFHSISLGSLTRSLKIAGFEQVRYEPHAATALFSHSTWKTRLSYLTADVVRYATFGSLDLSPGVVVYAQKAK